MAGPIASTGEALPHTETGRMSLNLAFFAICLSLAQAALMVVFRTGLPTPVLSYTIGPAILICTVLGPTLWASRAPDRVTWIGPLAIAVFLTSFVLISFGLLFQVLVFAAALFLLARALLPIKLPALSPTRLALWFALFLAVLAITTIQIAGIKYVNYVADQLALAGRTDGDMLMHAAIGNAIRYFHFPSTGIDGLHFTRYHFGIDTLTALLSRGTGFDIVQSMIAIKIPLLIPLMSFAAGWGALIIGRALMPQCRFSALALVTGSSVTAFLLETALPGNLSSYSDPLLLSGVLMMLGAPTIIRILNDDADPGTVRLAWSLAVLGVFLLGITKISNGFVWSGLVAFWALRRYGLGRGFWAVSIAAGIVFIPAYLLTVDREGARTILFGTPYFVERGFSKPLLVYFQPLAATLWLALMTRGVARGTRRFLIESLAIAIFVGMLPGLLMWIDGGDALQFMLMAGWFTLPILTALLAGLPDYVADWAVPRRRLVWSGAVLGVAACVVLSASDVRLKFNIFMAYNTLLHTGDRSYYDEDNKRGWREDGRRAWEAYGLGVFRLPPPPQAGKSLVDALLAYKGETGNEGAVYLAVQSDYWPLVSDCDGKVTYPMSMAGVPVIEGYLPVQSVCPQQFSLRGYGGWGAAPETRSDIGDEELCNRARQKGFSVVLRIESLAERSRDRKITCS